MIKYTTQEHNNQHKLNGTICTEIEPKMTNLKQAAQEYVGQVTGNVADLATVSVNLDLQEQTKQDKDGKDFTYKYILVEGKEYRVPGSVIGQIKELLKKFPNIENVTVMKQGEGKNDTRYTVIPTPAEGKQSIVTPEEKVQ